jgi:hypothetical protein
MAAPNLSCLRRESGSAGSASQDGHRLINPAHLAEAWWLAEARYSCIFALPVVPGERSDTASLGDGLGVWYCREHRPKGLEP